MLPSTALFLAQFTIAVAVPLGLYDSRLLYSKADRDRPCNEPIGRPPSLSKCSYRRDVTEDTVASLDSYKCNTKEAAIAYPASYKREAKENAIIYLDSCKRRGT